MTLVQLILADNRLARLIEELDVFQSMANVPCWKR